MGWGGKGHRLGGLPGASPSASQPRRLRGKAAPSLTPVHRLVQSGQPEGERGCGALPCRAGQGGEQGVSLRREWPGAAVHQTARSRPLPGYRVTIHKLQGSSAAVRPVSMLAALANRARPRPDCLACRHSVVHGPLPLQQGELDVKPPGRPPQAAVQGLCLQLLPASAAVALPRILQNQHWGRASRGCSCCRCARPGKGGLTRGRVDCACGQP